MKEKERPLRYECREFRASITCPTGWLVTIIHVSRVRHIMQKTRYDKGKYGTVGCRKFSMAFTTKNGTFSAEKGYSISLKLQAILLNLFSTKGSPYRYVTGMPFTI